MSHAQSEDSVSPAAAPPLAEDLAQACAGLAADPRRAAVIVDVDEVLALFVQGFRAWLEGRGYELRMERFTLFGGLFPAGGDAPVDKAEGRALFQRFFAEGCGELEVTPGAVESLAALSRRAQVVVLTAAPQASRPLRAAWLKAQGLDYPLVVNDGMVKGAAVKAMAQAVRGPAAFVDDLLPNLDSVAQEAPQVARFQLVADPALRPLAPAAPERHTRIDTWPELARAIEAQLFGAAPG